MSYFTLAKERFNLYGTVNTFRCYSYPETFQAVYFCERVWIGHVTRLTSHAHKTHPPMSTHIYASTHSHTHSHTLSLSLSHTHTHTHTHIYIYIYIYIYKLHLRINYFAVWTQSIWGRWFLTREITWRLTIDEDCIYYLQSIKLNRDISIHISLQIDYLYFTHSI